MEREGRGGRDMGRIPCCSKEGLNRGAWTAVEDKVLTAYITAHGEGNWRSLPKRAGLKRCGKSCRLRWLNYLRPDIKRGNISPDEEDLINRLHKLLGNRWSLIAGRLPGRTDNEIKNYWKTTLSKKLGAQTPPKRSNPRNNGKTRPKASNGEVNPTNPTALAQATITQQQQYQVIRTKASRCTKVFLDGVAPPQKLRHTAQFIELPNPRSTSNNNVVCYCGGEEATLNGSNNLMNLNNYIQFEQFNEPPVAVWMSVNSFLGESANMSLESLAFSMEEWVPW
ncbi:hypothetical protein Ancab_001862 [Ancistrocladus abbreviatus]